MTNWRSAKADSPITRMSGCAGEQAAGGLDAVHARHGDVHADQIDRLRCGDRQHLVAGGGFGHDLEVGLARQQRAQGVAEHLVVVGEDDAQAHRGGSGLVRLGQAG